MPNRLPTLVGKLLARARGRAGRLYRRTWADPRGLGRPKSADRWEAQYRQGRWDCLRDAEEVLRHDEIVEHLRPLLRPRILDVGCGEGLLLERIAAAGLAIRGYLGIDLSPEAIRRAMAMPTSAEGRFEVADFETWTTSRSFTVVVFNESLYYARSPRATLRRYLPMLEDGGHVVVSMCRTGNHPVIWAKLHQLIEPRRATRVGDPDRLVWDVETAAPRARPGLSARP